MIKAFIRRFRFTYVLYNFFYKKKLYHNEVMYKKLGLRKRYYSSISSKSFVGLSNTFEVSGDTKKITSCSLYNALSQEGKKSLDDFSENGFSIIKNYLSIEKVDAINAEIESLIDSKKIKFSYDNKIMFAIHSSHLLSSVGNDQQLIEVLSTLLGAEAILFQSINFLKGSEQHTHSDSIHMTTYPLGGLLGVWIALEDIDGDNGPLHYYPGSHKLPYYLNADYNNEGNFFLIGDKSYDEYENMISHKIKEFNINKVIFKASKGDLLIWHANLFHGGESHLNKKKTRKSMVLHYFKKDAICYHEITQRPALIIGKKD
jgi:phytanoyl-CoA hydroxylase